MSDLPICDCGSFWPNQGHHPECPVRREIERLRALEAQATAWSERLSGLREELRQVTEALDDPAVNIAYSLAEGVSRMRKRARLPEELVERLAKVTPRYKHEPSCGMWMTTNNPQCTCIFGLIRDILAAVEGNSDEQ